MIEILEEDKEVYAIIKGSPTLYDESLAEYIAREKKENKKKSAEERLKVIKIYKEVIQPDFYNEFDVEDLKAGIAEEILEILEELASTHRFFYQVLGENHLEPAGDQADISAITDTMEKTLEATVKPLLVSITKLTEQAFFITLEKEIHGRIETLTSQLRSKYLSWLEQRLVNAAKQ